eukprot:s4_g15.t1
MGRLHLAKAMHGRWNADKPFMNSLTIHRWKARFPFWPPPDASPVTPIEPWGKQFFGLINFVAFYAFYVLTQLTASCAWHLLRKYPSLASRFYQFTRACKAMPSSRFFAKAAKLYEYVSSPRNPGSPAGLRSPTGPKAAKVEVSTPVPSAAPAGREQLPNLLGSRRPSKMRAEEPPADEAMSYALAARRAFLEAQQRRAGRCTGQFVI